MDGLNMSFEQPVEKGFGTADLPPNSVDTPKKKKPTVKHHRTIWISDVHLGTKGCQAEFLLDFMRHNESEQLYLVGDIIDCWSLTRSWYWHQTHNDVVQKILRKARKGTEVIFVPGNHDEPLRNYHDLQVGDVKIAREIVHTAANGKRYLVIHGTSLTVLSAMPSGWLCWVTGPINC